MFTLDKADRRARNMSEDDGSAGIGHRRVHAQALRPRFEFLDPHLPVLRRGRGVPRLARASRESVGLDIRLLPQCGDAVRASARSAGSLVGSRRLSMVVSVAHAGVRHAAS